MTEKAMDKDSVSVNPNAKDGMKKHSTGAMITRGSSIPSTSKEKPLPNYLRASTNSCHDFCKDGWKEPLKTDTKLLSVLPKLNDNMKKHSTGGIITTGSSHPSTSKVKPLPRYLRASSNACHDFCKHGRKQVFEAERKHPSFLLKLNNKSKKLSTGGRITTGISLPSTSKVKILPRYLRASTNSCHDFCKYGWKYDFMAETKPLFFPNSINKLTLRDESYQVNKLNVEERNPCAIKLKPSSHRKAKFPDKPAVNKEKFSSKNKKDGFLEFPVKIKLQSPISTQTSSISNDHKVIPILTNEESQVRYTNLRDQKMKQVIKSKNLIESHSFSYHHKVGERSTDNGFDARQKTGIIKKRTLSLWEASSSFKPKLVKQTSLKSNITHKIPVPSKITPVSAASKKVSEITTVASRSVLSPSHEPTGRRNGKEVLAKSGEKKDMLEKKMLKPSTASPSLTYIGDGVLSLNHRKHKHGKEVIPDKNQEVGKAQYDSENNEEKTLYVNKRPEKAGLDSTEQKSSKTGNVVCDSSKQPLLKCENSDMDFPRQEMLEPENADIGVLGLKWQEVENINLHSFELNLDHQKLIEQTSVDINFPEKKLLNPENAIIVKPENADMGILGKNFLELENGNFDSFELDLDDQKLLEQKNADIDFLKQKLMNPENLENVDILKSGNTNMSVVGQKLLELDNINLHLFGLHPDDQEQKNVDMDFLEKNLLNPEKIENINMLKSENANMGVLGQKLLELENTNFDCFKLNPGDQKLLEQKNFDLNSLEKKFVNSDDPNNSVYIDLFKPENADMDVLGQNLLELENINLDSFELNPDNKKLFEQKNIDMDLLDDSSELKHDEDCKMVKLKNVDMSFLEQDSLMPEEVDFESLETEPTNQKLLELGKDYMDSPELKLPKPEDINLVDTLELKSDGADVNFLQEKLLKLENIDVDAMELKPSDDQTSQSATDDVEEIEESKSASSETTELDSQHEIKEDNDMDCMDSPELKLLKPEDINLVDTLELKSDGADVNFLQEKLLKLENIDVDALELKPSDDQPSQSATDDAEEIEESKSASSETTESDAELEIKEDNDMDCMDSPELKLPKPEDINLGDTLELKSDGADVNFLQEKLLKLENIDVDALELKPSDDQPSESATDDGEEIEESKSASSETTEWDSEHEIKEDNDMGYMDSPELKLPKPEEINLVDTLELKFDGADVNFRQETLLKLENIDFESLELKPCDDQPSQSATDDVEEIEKSESASSETTESDAELEIKEDNDMDCMDSPELKLLKPEDINLVDTLELKSDGADVNFLREKLLKLENIDVDALELKPSDDQPSESATDDVEEIEESKSTSSETTELDSQHEIKEDNDMGYMDSPELKLPKPEDINLVDTLELKSDGADVNFLQEKLLKLENIDVDALELKPSDDQPSESATDDGEEIEESKSASSETTEWDSEHDMGYIDSPELKLLKPEDINLVYTLELKFDDADVNFLQEKLLKLENIDVDSLELKPSDDQPSESATDDVEEIEDSKSASSETTESDTELEIKEDNDMDCMDSPELKLPKPEDINLVDTLELKSDGADVNFLQEKLLKLENINVDAMELKPSDDQPSQSATDDVEEIEESKSASSETTELDSQHEIKEDNDMDCMDSPELKLLKPEDINLVDTLELKSDGADVNFLQEKLLKLENIDVDALELKPSDDQPSQSATDDAEEIEESKSASSETTESDAELEIKEDNDMDCMDSPELKLPKPEDINLGDTLELKSDGADVNFLQEKLLKLENIDVDALELKPSDDQPSESATDDGEEIEESKSASSETTEWDSEHEIKEDNDMGYMDSPELKLPKPEEINLVDTLELKFDGADVNFRQETLLKLENIDFESLELKPCDDQPSQSATDDVEEIEKSESASSETTESDAELEINEDNDMDCMDSPELKLLKPEDINLVDTLELKSDGADVNFLREKLLKLENIDVDALELKPSDDQPSQSATDDAEEIEESKSASSETTESDAELEIKEDNDMDCMDSPELKLPKPEDINLGDTLELKSDGADVNFLQEKLLKLENIDVDALELKPSDDQPSESATDDGEEIEESKSASSETTEWDSEHDMGYIDSPELKLLKPEDINLVYTLELKFDDADVNFLQEKLLKLENIDVDSLELKPCDDQPSQSATDDVEEIEKSESASSETTESDSEHEINEDSDNCESLKSEQKRIVRRDAIVHHREDEFSIPHKLKFTRGKAIELQPENNGPKRLRFRRGRMVGRNVNSSHIERENFQRSEMANVVTDSNPETQSIVLKHQDTQEKKDVRGLFNNVIEETTNKLVETRKSKVKALIGAFEIVISLQ